jgi:hypothetical protein
MRNGAGTATPTQIAREKIFKRGERRVSGTAGTTRGDSVFDYTIAAKAKTRGRVGGWCLNFDLSLRLLSVLGVSAVSFSQMDLIVEAPRRGVYAEKS